MQKAEGRTFSDFVSKAAGPPSQIDNCRSAVKVFPPGADPSSAENFSAKVGHACLVQARVLTEQSKFGRLPSTFPCAGQSGQALIEACLVIGLICLLLGGFFQLAQIYSANAVAGHAAFRGARAKTVGFNDFMVAKTVRVGTIANAGQMTFPQISGGPLAQMAVERGRIPLYLGAEWHMLDGILQYEDWDTINYRYTDLGGASLFFAVQQDLPLRYFPAVFKAFYSADAFPINTEFSMENHAALYLE